MLAVAFLCPFIWMGSRRGLQTNRNDIKDWLPDDFPETAVHSWFQEHFPFEQFVLASWEGCTLDDQRLQLLARKLVPPEDFQWPAGEPRYFKSVMSGRSLVEQLRSRYPRLSQEEILQRLEGSLIGADHNKTCLVVTLTEEAKGKNLRPMLEKIRELARECGIEPEEEPLPEGLVARVGQKISRSVKDLIFGRDPPGEGIRLGGPPVDNVAIDVEGECTLFRLAGLSTIVGLGVSWLCFRSVRLTVLVFVAAVLSAGVGLAIVFFSGATFDAILLSMPSLIYVLAISGSIHIVNYYHDAIREDGLIGAPDRALRLGWQPCAIAAVTTALGLGSLYISHVIPIAKFGIYSAAGVLATLAFIFLFLPACLQLWPSRQYAAQFGGKGDTSESRTLLVRCWLRIGEFVVRRNVPVMVVCMAVLLLGAVPIVTIWKPLAGLPHIKTSVKLMKLFSSDAEIIHHYAWLEQHIGPLVPMEIILRIDNRKCELSTVQRMRLVQQVEQAVESLGDVGGVISAATFAPDIKPVRRQPSVWERIAGISNPQRTADIVLSKQINEHRQELRDYLAIDKQIAVVDGNFDPPVDRFIVPGKQIENPEQLIQRLEAGGLFTLADVEEFGDLEGGDLERIEGIDAAAAAAVATAIEKWRSERFDPTLEDLAEIEGPGIESSGIDRELVEKLKARQLNTLLAIEQYGDRKKSIEENLASIRGIDAYEAAAVAAAVDKWRSARGEELWRVSARVAALGDLDYGLFVDDLKAKIEPVLADYRAAGVEGIDATYTGLVPLVYKTQHELMIGLFESLALAFVLIALVMMLVLKSPSAGLLSMVPNVFPVVVIFGAMGWMGILVDIGTMMTASVALGVAVDDTIHYLTWFRRGLDEGRDRKGAVMLAYERCGTAMTQTTLIGGLGLAVFAFSTFTPTQRFGLLMFTLLFAALFGDLIFLPAVLSSPIGRFFRPSRKSPKERPGPRLPAEAAVSLSVPSAASAASAPSAKSVDEEVIPMSLGESASGQLPSPDPSRRSTKAS